MTQTYSVFNRTDKVIEGWYWVLKSNEIKRGQAKAVRLMGRELAVYRGSNNEVAILDAYCPHMGAHLAEGKVEGNTLRCLFHYWKFDARGQCVEIPSLNGRGGAEKFCTRSWTAKEKYGLVWIWVGEKPLYDVPDAPELEGQSHNFKLGISTH